MNKSILLVGTESSGIAYIAILLERAGYETVKRHDDQHLDQLLEAQPFALIIVDDQRPTLNAVEFCNRMRQQPATTDIPVILLLPVNENGTKAMPRAGCGATILTKPILPHVLLKTVADKLLQSEQSQSV